jgi:hypothetical protein
VSMLSELADRLLSELNVLSGGRICVACACHVLDTDYDGALKTMRELVANGCLTHGTFRCSACGGIALVAFTSSVRPVPRVCLICANAVAAEELHQHATGDYHKACFASIAAAGVAVERSNGVAACCVLCQSNISP